ncbi:MFS transporter [Nocardia panacis]|uniref:MFS transporter n=1 Tax=Nocardia panacis TaxID=2340916 RepID=A0A3A4KIW3_9NOCA|nr:MFS transporter [Nocardia panacis]RJO74812.1 MFS transporter [Nocardia panacis]
MSHSCAPEITRTPPGLRTGSTTLLAVAAGLLVANIYYAQPMLTWIGRDMGVAESDLGLVTALTQAGLLTGLILLVPLGDRYRKRTLIVWQTLAAAVGLAAIAMATATWVFFLANAIVGVVASVAQLITAYGATVSAPEQRGRAVGVITSGVVLGILLARTISGALADVLGWRSVYFASAAVMLVLAGALRRALPADPLPTERRPYGQLIGSLFTLTVREPVFRTRSLLGLFMFAAFGALWGSMALPLSDGPWHLSIGQIGLFGIAGAAGALGAARAGALADRGWGGRITGASVVLLTASWLLIGQLPSILVLLTIGIVVLDLAGQALHVINQDLIVRIDPAASSVLIGSYMVYYSLGFGGGAYAATAVYSSGGWTAVCLLGAALSLAATAIWAFDTLRDRRTGAPRTRAFPTHHAESGTATDQLR